MSKKCPINIDKVWHDNLYLLELEAAATLFRALFSCTDRETEGGGDRERRISGKKLLHSKHKKEFFVVEEIRS